MSSGTGGVLVGRWGRARAAAPPEDLGACTASSSALLGGHLSTCPPQRLHAAHMRVPPSSQVLEGRVKDPFILNW